MNENILTKRFTNMFTWFDYCYMVVMVLYMGQATPETSRMVGNMSGNPIPFLIPIILTFILCCRRPVSFYSKRLWIVMSIYFIWAILSIIKINVYTSYELSFQFFMIYALIVAYIQDAAYGKKLLTLYENVFVWICKITLILWIAYNLIPPFKEIINLFPDSGRGPNLLYVFQSSPGSLRNSGCSWEPGRFSIMIVLAIYCNLCRNGIRFHKNKNIWWFLASLASTMSTTGFSATIVLYGMFLLRKIDFKSISLFIGIMVPLVYGIMQLDFMEEKISTKLDDAQNTERLYGLFDWYKDEYSQDEYVYSLDRFDATVFEYMNFQQDPLLGYGRNFRNSFFYKTLSTNTALATGFMKVFSMYGIFMGIFFYYILYRSSRKISRESNYKQPLALFVTMCLISISYTVLSVPVFTAFWFYGVFASDKKKKSYVEVTV